jgi:hypothetical protein
MKKYLLTTVASLSLSIFAQAEIVKPNIYQKSFEVGKSIAQISIVGLKVKKVASLYNVVPNPDYQVLESASEYISTILEKETVVQASLRFQQSDAGEIEGGDINANFKLSEFTAEELEILSSNNIFKKYKLMKAKITYSIKEVTGTYKYEYCADRNFDDYNRPMSECPRIATAIGKSSVNKLTVSLK